MSRSTRFVHGAASSALALALLLLGLAGPPGAASAAEEEKVFDNGNIATVSNGPTAPTVFTLVEARLITRIATYHWNSGQGASPGQIALRGDDGPLYGPWQATGSPGQGGVPNAYWVVQPGVTLAEGRYQVLDSEPSTWAMNDGSDGQGFAAVWAAPPAADEQIFWNGNLLVVDNGPTAPTQLMLGTARHITKIWTYHWNYAQGATPGTIALQDQDGRVYGPWQATGLTGQGGVRNAVWEVLPDLTLPPGLYTVLDSQPSTWAQNAESGGQGFAWIWATPLGAQTPLPPPPPPSGGPNLIVNGDAEAGPGAPDDASVVPVPGWSTEGNFTATQYSLPGSPTPSDPGPADRGVNYFIGGPSNSASRAVQVVDVSGRAAAIDGGGVTFTLSGYLGGYGSQGDSAVLTATFRDASGTPLGSAAIGPVTPAERSGQTGLLQRTASGSVP